VGASFLAEELLGDAVAQLVRQVVRHRRHVEHNGERWFLGVTGKLDRLNEVFDFLRSEQMGSFSLDLCAILKDIV